MTAAACALAILCLPTVAMAQNSSDMRYYKLAPGDRMLVTVFGQADLSGPLSVDGTGHVFLPLIGSVDVMGLSALQAQERIADLLRNGILQQPVVNVGIAEVRPVSVMGNVRNPGVYPFRFGSILKGAIAQAGGYGLLEQFPGATATELVAAEERLKILTAERRLLLIRQARLEAQMAGEKSFKAPFSPQEENDPEIAKLVKQEQKTFEIDSAGFKRQLDMITSQKPQFLSESEAIDGQIATGEKQLDIMRKQMQDYNRLVEKGLGRTNSIVEMQLGEANIETNNYRLKGDQSRVRNQALMLDIQLVDYENAYKRRLQADLQFVQQRLREIEVALPSALQARDLRARIRGEAIEGVVRVITVTRVSNTGEAKSLEAAETTVLEPGDIIEVKSAPAKPDGALAPLAEMSAGQAAPTAQAINR